MDQKRHSGVGTGEVVPFGKYKGQPVEALAADPAYLDWLTAQPWFRERFASLYTIVINNFREPDETPEHNAMQVRFLDPAYVAKVVVAFTDRMSRGFLFDIDVRPSRFEVRGADVLVGFSGRPLDSVVRGNSGLDDEFGVELKPTMADDYPAVLRQVLAQRSTRLVMVGRYDGVGATWDQVVATFRASGVALLREADIHVVPMDALDDLRDETYAAARGFAAEYSWRDFEGIDRDLLTKFDAQCDSTWRQLKRGADRATADVHVQSFNRGLSLVRAAMDERREERRAFEIKYPNSVRSDRS